MRHTGDSSSIRSTSLGTAWVLAAMEDCSHVCTMETGRLSAEAICSIAAANTSVCPQLLARLRLTSAFYKSVPTHVHLTEASGEIQQQQLLLLPWSVFPHKENRATTPNKYGIAHTSSLPTALLQDTSSSVKARRSSRETSSSAGSSSRMGNSRR